MLKQNIDNIIKYSENESNLFGMNIFNGRIDTIDIKNINKVVLDNDVDIVNLTIDSDKKNELKKLNNLSFKYSCSYKEHIYTLNTEQLSKTENTDQQSTCHEIDIAEYQSKIEREEISFDHFESSYQFNSYIEKPSLKNYYTKSTLSIIESLTGKCLGISQNNQLVCLVNVSENSETTYLIFNLLNNNNIDYISLINSLNNWLINQSYKSIVLSCSSTNLSLQNSLIKNGFLLEKSITTIQIYPMLSYTKLPELDFDFSISEEEIKMFGEVSGDFNPLHYDDEFAKKMGFKSKISHGLIGNSIMSKYFGTVFPGNGTIFLNYFYIFLNPIYPNETYNVKINFPKYIQKSGLYEAVVKIVGPNNEPCLISLNTLLKR